MHYAKDATEGTTTAEKKRLRAIFRCLRLTILALAAAEIASFVVIAFGYIAAAIAVLLGPASFSSTSLTHIHHPMTAPHSPCCFYRCCFC